MTPSGAKRPRAPVQAANLAEKSPLQRHRRSQHRVAQRFPSCTAEPSQVPAVALGPFIRRMEALVPLSGPVKSHHGRMSGRYRSKELHADLSADGPHDLDGQPVTGQQFNRYMFSDCDPERAVDVKAAPRVVHDYDGSTDPSWRSKSAGMRTGRRTFSRPSRKT